MCLFILSPVRGRHSLWRPYLMTNKGQNVDMMKLAEIAEVSKSDKMNEVAKIVEVAKNEQKSLNGGFC